MTSRRELAYQIAEQFRVLGKPLGLRDCIVVGGMGKTATRALEWTVGPVPDGSALVSVTVN